MDQILYQAEFETPIGPMLALTSTTGLCALEVELPARRKLLAARMKKWFAEYEMKSMPGVSNAPIANWLTAYFRREFLPHPPLDLRGSAFEQTVWKALLAIPVARTTTYGNLAASLGNPGSARAIGTAVRRNPISLIVPCHRVIGADGALRGYGGGLPQKQWLLHHEALECEAA